jgi:Leucine-rich repeat (LRR) protein
MQQAEIRRVLVQRIRNAGGFVEYDYQSNYDAPQTWSEESPGPRWLKNLLGDDLFHNVTGVNTRGATADSALLKEFEKFPHLQFIFIDPQQSNDEILKSWQDLSDLRDVGLSEWPVQTDRHETPSAVTDAGLQHLNRMSNLEQLWIGGSQVSDAGLEQIAATHPRLKALSLNSTKITDKGLASLEKLPNLTVLQLMHTDITDAGLAHVATLSRLEYLLLSNTNISDQGLEFVKDLRQLKLLNVQDTKISDTGLKNLQDLTKLEVLALGRTRITDEGLRNIANLSSLMLLSLDGTDVTDDGMIHLSGLKKLEELYLAATRVTGAGFENLSQSKMLRHLDLRDSALSDAGLTRFPGIPLTSADLDRTSITDASIPKLQSFTTLIRLRIEGTKITAAGYNRLKTALPTCDIKRSISPNAASESKVPDVEVNSR